MTSPIDALTRLNSGDIIRFRTRHEDLGDCEAEVILTTVKGVMIDTLDDVESLKGETEGLWIEDMTSANEDYPVLLGQGDTDPRAIITEIDVLESESHWR